MTRNFMHKQTRLKPTLTLVVAVGLSLLSTLWNVHAVSSSAEYVGNNSTPQASYSQAKQAQPAGSREGEEPNIPDAEYLELQQFYFYIDAGHSPEGNQCGNADDPTGRGTGPWWGIYEGDMTLLIANTLRALLVAHGANPQRVIMSRTGAQGVSLEQRTDGVAVSGPCNTYGNNQAYVDNGSPYDRWRFISIHQNCCINGGSNERVEVFRKRNVTNPLADEYAENVMYQIDRPYDHPGTAYWGNWTQEGDPYVVRNSRPWQNGQFQQSFNILTENGYLSDYNFNTWIRNSSNVVALASAYYRGMVDFFVVGKQGSVNSKNQGVITEYRSMIAAGKDPGVPFNNGGGYYVHPWGLANTQEFFSNPGQVPGSVLQSTSGGSLSEAFYLRGPFWYKYISKGGPFSSGLGLPKPGYTGHEHPLARRA